MRSSFVVIEGYLVYETSSEYVIDFYAPTDQKDHLCHLPKSSITIEDSTYVGRVKYLTISLPEWLAIELDVVGFCQLPQKPGRSSAS